MVSQQTINSLIEKGILVSPELKTRQIDESLIQEIIDFYGTDIDYLDDEIIQNFAKTKQIRKAQEDGKEIFGRQTEASNQPNDPSPVTVIQSYKNPPRKRTYQDFVSVFNMRFKNITDILRKRQELQNITSLSRVKSKTNNEKVSVIGMVLEKATTKNNNILIKVEDLTGICTCIIKNDEKNKETYDQANDVVLDEVIGITGTFINGAIFVDKILLPDVPYNKELKKQKEEEYLIMLGDTHFGSKVFMKEEFQKFLSWIQGKIGTDEQKDIASKVRYLILSGDIVEGIGIYPGQEEDLEIQDITKQYEEAARQIGQIPSHIKIIMMSGNHDAGRLSEPQETPYKDIAKAIWALPNITLVSNPAYVNIGAKDGFPGFDLLLYHGGSLIYYSENVPSIRAAGGQKRSDLIMKFLLQRRHLAPTHGSTLYLPDPDKDYLLIDPIPDFLITGHIHRSTAANYRNVTMINASCWTETTEDQIKRGLETLPARLPLVNLKTREIRIMNFLTKKAKEKEEETLKEVKELAKKT